MFYFEVLILSLGKDGSIGVGLCEGGAKGSKKGDSQRALKTMPGFRKGSVGLHSDGSFYHGDAPGKAQRLTIPNNRRVSTTFGVGDTIGCGIDEQSTCREILYKAVITAPEASIRNSLLRCSKAGRSSLRRTAGT